MNGRGKVLLVCVGAVLAMCSLTMADEESKSNDGKITVGVFDSRAVAVAHFGKFMKDGGLEKLYSEHAKAKKDGDTKRAAELEAEGQELQKQIHLRVFGSAPIDDILKEIEKDIEAIAQEQNLDIVVSKWDITYQKPSAEFVDITDRLVNLFEPDEETLKKIKTVMEHAPVPMEKLEKMDHSKD